MGEVATVDRLLTAEDLAAMPSGGRRLELVQGRLVTMAPAGEEHGVQGMALMVHLGHWVIENGLGRVYLAETGFVLSRDPDTVRAPDGAFLRRERQPADLGSSFATVLPDLVVEVASPTDSQHEVLGKVGDWLDAGVAVVWVLWPRAQCLQVWRAGHEATTLYADDTLTCADLLPGFELPLRKVFKEAP